ncbi:mechanosensitive ion channel [Bacillus daqingensis]|uniref:Mechanosensitive ion channel n=1 Tax=Bacillus daqingensis TaxID=872396 RepID=A0ABV9NZW6_9BACI
MNNVTNEFQALLSDLIGSLANIVVALLLLLLAWVIALAAKNIISKGLKKLGAHKGLAKTPLVKSEEQGASILEATSKLVYFLVFILFLPAILDALNMESVAGPIANMTETFLEFLPNIFAAAIILFVGIFIARLVKDLVYRSLESLKVDHWFNKWTRFEGSSSMKLSAILANIVFIFLLIPIITVALETLNIQMISEPITNVFNSILAMIPNVFVAIILVLVGYFIARFVGDLLINLLQRTGVDNVYSFFEMDGPKSSSFRVSTILGQIVKVVIIIFFTVEALNVLQLEVLNNIGGAVLAYLPLLVSALLILLLGLFAGHYLGALVKKYSGSGFYASLVKYTIIVFAAFMTFDQLQFATTIVNLAFLLILGAVSVAFAIAFGVGGRDYAKTKLAELDRKMKKENDKPADPSAGPKTPGGQSGPSGASGTAGGSDRTPPVNPPRPPEEDAAPKPVDPDDPDHPDHPRP